MKIKGTHTYIGADNKQEPVRKDIELDVLGFNNLNLTGKNIDEFYVALYFNNAEDVVTTGEVGELADYKFNNVSAFYNGYANGPDHIREIEIRLEDTDNYYNRNIITAKVSTMNGATEEFVNQLWNELDSIVEAETGSSIDDNLGAEKEKADQRRAQAEEDELKIDGDYAPDVIEKAQEIFDNSNLVGADIYIDKDGVSVLVKDTVSNTGFWFDIFPSKEGDLEGDWNQYIFHNNFGDQVRSALQNNGRFFEAVFEVAENYAMEKEAIKWNDETNKYEFKTESKKVNKKENKKGIGRYLKEDFYDGDGDYDEADWEEEAMGEEREDVEEYIISFEPGELYDQYGGEFITENDWEADDLFEDLKEEHKLDQVDKYMRKVWKWDRVNEEYYETDVEIYFNAGDELEYYDESKKVEGYSLGDDKESFDVYKHTAEFLNKVGKALEDLGWKFNKEKGKFEKEDITIDMEAIQDNVNDLYIGSNKLKLSKFVDDFSGYEDIGEDTGIIYYVSTKAGDYEARQLAYKINSCEKLEESKEIKTEKDHFNKAELTAVKNSIDTALDDLQLTSTGTTGDYEDRALRDDLRNVGNFVDRYITRMGESKKVTEESKLTERIKDGKLVSTGLNDKKAEDVLESVIGQMSDGIWENTSQMNRYWNYADIVEENGELFIKVDTEDYSSGFKGKTDDEVRRFFANKVKQIAKIYIDDYRHNNNNLKWDRNCTEKCEYLDYNSGVTIQDAYRVYDKLLGRIDRIKTEAKPEEADKKIWEKVEHIVDAADNELGPDQSNEYQYNEHIKFVIYRDFEYEDIFEVYTYVDGKVQEDLDTGDVHLEDLDATIVDIIKNLKGKKIESKEDMEAFDMPRYTVYEYENAYMDELLTGGEPSPFTIYDNELDDFYYDELNQNPVFDTEEEAEQYIRDNKLNEALTDTDTDTDTDKVIVYQIDNTENCDYAFMDYTFAKEKGIDLKDYKKTAEVQVNTDLDGDVNSILELVFSYGNTNQEYYQENPEARSISVSDILEYNGKKYYVDSFGFEEVVGTQEDNKGVKTESRYIVYDYTDGDTMQDEEEKGLEPSQFTIYDNEADDFYYDELGNNPVFDKEEDAEEYIKKNLTETKYGDSNPDKIVPDAYCEIEKTDNGYYINCGIGTHTNLGSGNFTIYPEDYLVNLHKEVKKLAKERGIKRVYDKVKTIIPEYNAMIPEYNTNIESMIKDLTPFAEKSKQGQLTRADLDSIEEITGRVSPNRMSTLPEFAWSGKFGKLRSLIGNLKRYETDLSNPLARADTITITESKEVKTESKEDTKYIVCSYYDEKLHGLEDDLYTNEWDDVEEFAHRKLMQGNMIEIENTKTGKNKRINPDEYNKEFDGEFIVRQEELDEDKKITEAEDLKAKADAVKEKVEKEKADLGLKQAEEMVDTENELTEGIKKEIIQYAKQQGLDVEKLQKQGELNSVAEALDNIVGEMVSKSANEFMDTTGKNIEWDFEVKDNNINVIWNEV